MEKSYFKLFANCIPVKGKNSALIYDFQKFRFYKISNDLAELLPLLQNVDLEMILNNNSSLHSTLNSLVDEEIGFITTYPEKFPALNDEWYTPSYIENAMIGFGPESNHNLTNIFSNLAKLKCYTVAFIFQYKPSFELLLELLKTTQKFEFGYIEIWLIESIKKQELNKIVKTYDIVRRIKIFNSDRNEKTILKQAEIEYLSQKTFQEFCKNEQPIFNLNYSFYCESKRFNNCLNKKLSIDSMGNIKNCLYLDKCYGNIYADDLVSIAKSEKFQDLWKVTKDQIDGCNQCEYRYACKDCRAFTMNGNIDSKPLSCDLY